MTLLPAVHNAAKVAAPKYFVSGAASKPPETFQKLSKDEIPAFKGSDGLLLMQSTAAMYNVANDDPHGTQGEPVLAAQVTYWVLNDTEELPAACTWIFPAIGIGVLQFAATATDKAKQEVKSGLNHYLLTRTFPKGIRGDYEFAEQEQMFINTVGDQHNAESDFREADLYYSKVTQFKAKKFAEFFGNRRKKKKKVKNPNNYSNEKEINNETHEENESEDNVDEEIQILFRNLQFPQLPDLALAMSHYNPDCLLENVQRH